MDEVAVASGSLSPDGGVGWVANSVTECCGCSWEGNVALALWFALEWRFRTPAAKEREHRRKLVRLKGG